MRPTRRFFNTPHQDDALDKATLEEYSAADALFEPELLAQLFHHRAALEQLRAALEELRTTRNELRETATRARADLSLVHEQQHAEREECVRRMRQHTERVVQLQQEQSQANLNARSAYLMGRSLREQSGVAGPQGADLEETDDFVPA
jgi:chromosome segregation ATPase